MFPTVGDAEIDTFPISIDFDHWTTLGERPRRRRTRHRQELGVEFVFAGVDRLDYTKGIDQRLRAFGELLDHGTARSGERAASSRSRFRAGRRSSTTARSATRSNGWSTTSTTATAAPTAAVPVHHITSQLDESELAEWYRAADCLVVTSYADGMNLVAKEFVAARDDLDASVVLSRVRRRRPRHAGRADRQPVRHRRRQAGACCSARSDAVGRARGADERDARSGAQPRRAPLGQRVPPAPQPVAPARRRSSTEPASGRRAWHGLGSAEDEP